MTLCPMCQGEMRTESADGEVWAVCPDCDLRYVLHSPTVTEEKMDSTPTEEPSDRPVTLYREGAGVLYRRDVGLRILDLCRANCIGITPMGEHRVQGVMSECYELDILADEWMEISKEASL